jgi:hypothetical protein
VPSLAPLLRSGGSGPGLDDLELVPVQVLELEHGRDTRPPEQVPDLDAPLPHGRVLGFRVGNQEPDAGVGPVSGLVISATEMDAFGADTVTQRKLSPIVTSSRFSKPSLPTKNSTALSWSLTGIPTAPISVMVVWDMTISSRLDEREPGYRCWYMSDPGVVSVSPVSSQVFRPERIIGHPP